MSNNTDPRFTVWKEHSRIFQESRYILYDGGVYKKGFDDEKEAIQYAEMITEIDPKDELISNRDGYKIIKSWSYVYDAFRFVVYKYKSQGGINFFDYENSFPTKKEAIDMVCDERHHPELVENKGAPDPVQIYPAQ